MTVEVLGIDLGTTNSVVATVDGDGEVLVLANAMGEETTASVVYFDPVGENRNGAATVIVGSEARVLAAADPDNGVMLVKRHMGTEFTVHVAGQSHTPESISALILRQLVAAATRSASPRAVITVPAYFGTAEREATIQAARIAGLDVLELVDEPVAAAMHYGLAGGSDRTILVYDLGGGTFDTTILHVHEGNITVIATDGHNKLGGADIDERLLNLVLARVERDISTSDYDNFVDNPSALGELRVDVERAKKALSQSTSRDLLVRTTSGSMRIKLTRADLEDACSDLFATTLELIERVRAEARGKGVDVIDEVIMVGGSSRIPMLTDALEAALALQPRLVEPDLAVAKGAAIRAHQLAATSEYEVWLRRRQGLLSPSTSNFTAATRTSTSNVLLAEVRPTVTAVSPRAVGVLVHDSFDESGTRRFVEHLVAANTMLPVKVMKQYATIQDAQESVRIQVYEQAGARPSDEIDHNRLVIDGELTGFGDLAAGSVIEVTLDIASDGRITVSAVEPVTKTVLNLEAFVAGVIDSRETDALTARISLMTVRG